MASGFPALDRLYRFNGPNTGSGLVPTQSFNASNVVGTVVPQVGDAKGRPNYAGVIASQNTKVVIGTVLVLVALGYFLYHINFEK